MTFPITDPVTKTDGLKNFVASIANHLEAGNVEDTKAMLCDLWNDIGGAYVCQEQTPTKMSPVPEYDPATDGDYSAWLAFNNID